DLAVVNGDTILLVNPTELLPNGGEYVVLFTGSAYVGSVTMAVQVYVDGVAIPGAKSAVQSAAPNLYMNIALSVAIEGLSPGAHTVEIRYVGDGNCLFLVESLPYPAASVVVQTVAA